MSSSAKEPEAVECLTLTYHLTKETKPVPKSSWFEETGTTDNTQHIRQRDCHPGLSMDAVYMLIFNIHFILHIYT
jgi:hypothetical protein